jgi:hypothetical protein
MLTACRASRTRGAKQALAVIYNAEDTDHTIKPLGPWPPPMAPMGPRRSPRSPTTSTCCSRAVTTPLEQRIVVRTTKPIKPDGSERDTKAARHTDAKVLGYSSFGGHSATAVTFHPNRPSRLYRRCQAHVLVTLIGAVRTSTGHSMSYARNPTASKSTLHGTIASTRNCPEQRGVFGSTCGLPSSAATLHNVADFIDGQPVRLARGDVRRVSSPTVALLLFVVGLLVGGYVWATTDGLSVGQRDAVEYASTAQSLRAGRGFTVPFGSPGLPIDFEQARHVLQHYAPGYPVLLAALTPSGVNPFGVSRWVQLVLVLLCGLLAYVIVARATSGKHLTAATVSVVTLCGTVPHALGISSEPLFFALLLGTLGACVEYRSGGGRLWLYLATALAASGFAVRYVGAALVATVAFTVLAEQRTRLRTRVVQASVLAVLASMPMTLWLLYSNSRTGITTDRTLALHPFSYSDLKILTATIVRWIVPSPIPLSVGVGAILALTVLFSILVKRCSPFGQPVVRDVRLRAITLVAACFLVIYSAGIVAAVSLFDAQLTPGSRIMFTAFVAVLFGAVALLSAISRGRTAVVALTGTLVVVAAMSQAVSALRQLHDGDRGFNSRSWRTSTAIADLSAHPYPQRIFSNAPDAIYFLTGRSAFSVPTRHDPWSGHLNHVQLTELTRLARAARDGAVIVIFDDVSRPYLMDVADMTKAGLKIEQSYGDAVRVSAR